MHSGFNGVIKGTVTFREKLPVEQFIDTVLIKMTSEISTDYATGKRAIAEEPTITIDAWREASLWLQKSRCVKVEESAELVSYCVASSQLEVDRYDKNFVDGINATEFKSLDEYREKRFAKFWTVKLDKTAWHTQSLCDCPSFLKNYYCKHVIALALRKKLCKLPKKALTAKITKAVNKKGRVAKSTAALEQ